MRIAGTLAMSAILGMVACDITINALDWNDSAASTTAAPRELELDEPEFTVSSAPPADKRAAPSEN